MIKNGGYLTMQIRLLNGRIFNRILSEDKEALYSAEQGKILSCLWARTPMTATDLAIATGLANNTLTSMLRKLEEQKLIKSYTHPKDKRKKFFELTEIGESQRAVGIRASKKLDEIFYKGFSKEEITKMEGYMERILENMKEAEQRYIKE